MVCDDKSVIGMSVPQKCIVACDLQF